MRQKGLTDHISTRGENFFVYRKRREMGDSGTDRSNPTSARRPDLTQVGSSFLLSHVVPKAWG